jgi:hypothetical protein
MTVETLVSAIKAQNVTEVTAILNLANKDLEKLLTSQVRGGKTPLYVAFEDKNINEDVLSVLFGKLADFTKDQLNSVFTIKTNSGAIPLSALLADNNAVDNLGKVLDACGDNQELLTNFLSIQDSKDQTIFHWMSTAENADITKVIVKALDNVDASAILTLTSKIGNSAIIDMVKNGNLAVLTETLALLKTPEAVVKVLSKQGELGVTPIEAAFKTGDVAIMTSLFQLLNSLSNEQCKAILNIEKNRGLTLAEQLLEGDVEPTAFQAFLSAAKAAGILNKFLSATDLVQKIAEVENDLSILGSLLFADGTVEVTKEAVEAYNDNDVAKNLPEEVVTKFNEKIEAAHIAEEARIVEEARIAEENRVAEEIRVAEVAAKEKLDFTTKLDSLKYNSAMNSTDIIKVNGTLFALKDQAAALELSGKFVETSSSLDAGLIVAEKSEIAEKINFLSKSKGYYIYPDYEELLTLEQKCIELDLVKEYDAARQPLITAIQSEVFNNIRTEWFAKVGTTSANITNMRTQFDQIVKELPDYVVAISETILADYRNELDSKLTTALHQEKLQKAQSTLDNLLTVDNLTSTEIALKQKELGEFVKTLDESITKELAIEAANTTLSQAFTATKSAEQDTVITQLQDLTSLQTAVEVTARQANVTAFNATLSAEDQVQYQDKLSNALSKLAVKAEGFNVNVADAEYYLHLAHQLQQAETIGNAIVKLVEPYLATPQAKSIILNDAVYDKANKKAGKVANTEASQKIAEFTDIIKLDNLKMSEDCAPGHSYKCKNIETGVRIFSDGFAKHTAFNTNSWLTKKDYFVSDGNVSQATGNGDSNSLDVIHAWSCMYLNKAQSSLHVATVGEIAAKATKYVSADTDYAWVATLTTSCEAAPVAVVPEVAAVEIAGDAVVSVDNS